MTRIIELYDLDGTTINSDHRVQPCLRANGDLDLKKYIEEACTPEKVHADTLLPLAAHMKAQKAKGVLCIIVTARYMQNHDYAYLRKQGLMTGMVCSRDRLQQVFGREEAQRISALGDAAYKAAWFNHLWHCYPNSSFIMYDDHKGVLQAATKHGITAFDATVINQMLTDTVTGVMEDMLSDEDTMIDSVMDDILLTYRLEKDMDFINA